MNQTEIVDLRGHQTIVESSAVGPPGPPGVGSALTTYEHNQAAASATWIINHNLGFKPSISLRTTGDVEFEAEIGHTSLNQAVATLSRPLAGVARCN